MSNDFEGYYVRWHAGSNAEVSGAGSAAEASARSEQ
jgi:hypothetical protein